MSSTYDARIAALPTTEQLQLRMLATGIAQRVAEKLYAVPYAGEFFTAAGPDAVAEAIADGTVEVLLEVRETGQVQIV